jgi:hypothetical protein
MGIVAWITLRAELMSSVQETYLLGTERLEDLIEYVYPVERGCWASGPSS